MAADAVPAVVGVLAEQRPGERRVALVPDGVTRLRARGHRVLVQAGAGSGAWCPDADYVAAGADVVARDQVWAADVVLGVHLPDDATAVRPGHVLVGLFAPLVDPGRMAVLAALGATVISLDGLPRTLSRAQQLDVLTSQASVAGYKAAVLAADTYGGFFPLLSTAAGTSRPARVLVMGAGVAGLQCLATARRLGADVTGYDVRPAARAEVTSTGARWLALDEQVDGEGGGGYARALTADEQEAQVTALEDALSRFDVVVTTAAVPGRRPPLLVTEAALAAMRPGSVVVDLGSGASGGNVAGSAPGASVLTPGGVTVLGAGDLPARLPVAASAAWSRNVCAVLAHLAPLGAVAVDLADEITAGLVVTQDGAVVHPAVRELLRTGGGRHDTVAVG